MPVPACRRLGEVAVWLRIKMPHHSRFNALCQRVDTAFTPYYDCAIAWLNR
jgi:hypothetical protein